METWRYQISGQAAPADMQCMGCRYSSTSMDHDPESEEDEQQAGEEEEQQAKADEVAQNDDAFPLSQSVSTSKLEFIWLNLIEYLRITA